MEPTEVDQLQNPRIRLPAAGTAAAAAAAETAGRAAEKTAAHVHLEGVGGEQTTLTGYPKPNHNHIHKTDAENIKQVPKNGIRYICKIPFINKEIVPQSSRIVKP